MRYYNHEFRTRHCMDDLKISERTIDIEKLFRSKSTRMADLMPGFIFHYLRRVIHEAEINKALYDNRDVFGLGFIRAILNMFGARVVSHGIDNIPSDGRYIIASNHPLGGLDGLALMDTVGKVRNDIVFPVNDLLLFLPNLRELFIPINKHGSNSENLRIIHDTLSSEKTILFFPAGLVSRKQGRIIRDLEWKKTVITFAVKYRRSIIPTYIDGRNSAFFYNLARLRKWLGIKSNIEMLYLPDEMFRQKNKTIDIIFGPPIDYKKFDKTATHAQWALKLKEHVYELRNDPHKIF